RKSKKAAQVSLRGAFPGWNRAGGTTTREACRPPDRESIAGVAGGHQRVVLRSLASEATPLPARCYLAGGRRSLPTYFAHQLFPIEKNGPAAVAGHSSFLCAVRRKLFERGMSSWRAGGVSPLILHGHPESGGSRPRSSETLANSTVPPRPGPPRTARP